MLPGTLLKRTIDTLDKASAECLVHRNLGALLLGAWHCEQREGCRSRLRSKDFFVASSSPKGGTWGERPKEGARALSLRLL